MIQNPIPERIDRHDREIEEGSDLTPHQYPDADPSYVAEYGHKSGLLCVGWCHRLRALLFVHDNHHPHAIWPHHKCNAGGTVRRGKLDLRHLVPRDPNDHARLTIGIEKCQGGSLRIFLIGQHRTEATVPIARFARFCPPCWRPPWAKGVNSGSSPLSDAELDGSIHSSTSHRQTRPLCANRHRTASSSSTIHTPGTACRNPAPIGTSWHLQPLATTPRLTVRRNVSYFTALTGQDRWPSGRKRASGEPWRGTPRAGRAPP